MIWLEIINRSGAVVFSNLKSKHKQIFENYKLSKKDGLISMFKENRNGVSLWLIADDNDLYNSSKVAKKNFGFVEKLVMGIYKHYELITLSNTHTIATIQAKMSQQIEGLLGSSKKHRGNYQEITSNMEKKILEDSYKASCVFCDLSKRIEEIDTHLKSLKILANKTAVDLTEHPLKSMLLNIYSPFQNNFKNKNIKINFDRVATVTKCLIDYKIFSLVMHHFFDNAVKYSKTNDEISFVFSADSYLVINMHSITIEDGDNIFDMGVSGQNTDTLAGDGIGMHVIKQGLNIMDMDIEVRCSGKLEKHKKYSKNQFIIKCNVN